MKGSNMKIISIIINPHHANMFLNKLYTYIAGHSRKFNCVIIFARYI